jgi:putative DNA modification/repair radical SAM protein
MHIQRKLEILATGARYDASCASSGSQRRSAAGGVGNAQSCGICHSFTPDGRCISLLKVLLTNSCVYDCLYCVNRRSNNISRARFTPEQLASLTIEFYKRNYIEGLFLSSGVIKNPDYTMEELNRTARLLRTVYRFNGYIHLKAIPGASQELLLEAGRWADRLSANIELPIQQELNTLACKRTKTRIDSAVERIGSKLLETTGERKKHHSIPSFAPAGQSTQMIVGATPSSDFTLLKKASELYQNYQLRRVYYSAFTPIPNASLQLPRERTPLIREHRLYQADWLYRYYDFEVDELFASSDSNLDIDIDPKSSWALRNRGFFPVDVNKAPREELLRVPGLGQRSVGRILGARKHRSITSCDLKRLHVPLKRAKFFILTADRRVDPQSLDRLDLKSMLLGGPTQLSLFSEQTMAISGEL